MNRLIESFYPEKIDSFTTTDMVYRLTFASTAVYILSTSYTLFIPALILSLMIIYQLVLGKNELNQPVL